jgi:hypothetical protein
MIQMSIASAAEALRQVITTLASVHIRLAT